MLPGASMKLTLLLLLVLLPIAFSIEQISDDTVQPSPPESQPAQTSETAQVSNTQDDSKSPSQADPILADNSQSAKPTSQTAPQEIQPAPDNEIKSTISANPTPIPASETIKTTPMTTSANKAPENSQVYVSKDDDSSCKGMCFSGGVCQKDVCICPPGYSGARCEIVFDANESKYQAKMDAIISKYYYALFGFVGLIAAMVVAECCCKGGSENLQKEDVPVNEGHKYVDLDLEAAPGENRNNADGEPNIAPLEPVEVEEQHHTEPVEAQNYVEPEVVLAENYAEPVPIEEQNYENVEVEVAPVDEQQYYVEPEAVQVEEEQNYQEE